MPGAASCQPAAVALPPARFRASAEPNASKSAIPEAPVPLGLPPPRVACKSPRRASGESKGGYDAGSSSSCAQQRASDTAPATNRCLVPAGSSQQQQKAPSIMELVNAAARKDEKQEALVRAGICASPRIGSSSRGASPRGAPFFSPFGPSSEHVSRDQSLRSQGPSASASRPPVARSPRAQHSSSAGSGSASSTPCISAPAAAANAQHTSAAPPKVSTATAAAAAKASAVGTSKPPLSPMAGSAGSSRHSTASLFAQHSSSSNSSNSRPATVHAAVGLAGQQQQQQHVAAAPAPQQPSTFAAASAAAAAAAAGSAPSHAISSSSSSKGAIPAPLLTGMHSAPPAIGSDCASDDGSLTPEFSLCSSASSSSLCSYGSLASSICSTGSRPKSILVRRSFSSSGASSPRGPKHVRWRDGESVREEGGSDLVAVLLLQDTPEIRKLRKDTWPERSKGRDLQELTVTIPIRIGGGSSSSSNSGAAATAGAAKHTPREDPSAATAAAAENPLVATVKDWREKLRALSAERRAQRVAEMQDTWAARQAAQQRQMLQRQQREEAAAAAAAAAAPTAAAAEAAEAVKPTAAAAAGPVITLQAVAGNISQPVC